MTENAKTFLLAAGLVGAFTVLRLIVGDGATLAVAMSAMSFCLGAIWSAGEQKRRSVEGEGSK